MLRYADISGDDGEWCGVEGIFPLLIYFNDAMFELVLAYGGS